MKLFVLLIIIVFSSVSVYAQAENIFKRKPMDEAKLKMLLEDRLSRLPPKANLTNPVPDAKNMIPQQTKNGVYKIPLKGVYIGDNGKGDEIYAMTPDNMPCLVPGKSSTSNMPVVGGKMLNQDKPLLLKENPEKTPADK